jgi:glycerol-3-phosphate acyltransferase PlsY
LSVTAHGYLAAALAVVGHVWPLWHGFRGGKGAATGVGGLLVLWPWIVPLLLLAWILVLVSTGYVGLSTVVAALCLPLLAWGFDAGPERMWFCIGMGLFLAWTHRANLVRLWHGKESRFERARLLYRLYGRSRY